jgi:hypothetical protein
LGDAVSGFLRRISLKFELVVADVVIGWQEHKPRSMSDQPTSEEILMSTSAVSSTSSNQELQQYFQTRHSDLQQLGQALASGNLASAQTAYNNIVSLGKKGPFAAGNPFYLSSREQDFQAVGQALQSGDLAGAKQAFSALKATFQRGQQLDPPPFSSAAASGPEIILNLSPINGGSGASGPEQITINISNPASGGEQVSIGIGSQGSSNAEQITLNLPSNSNEQIVLNLLGASSTTTGSPTTTGGSTPSGGLSVSA